MDSHHARPILLLQMAGHEDPMKTLYPFQQSAVSRILETPGMILADACGLGKTLTAIEVAKQSRGDNDEWRGLVVVPLSLRPQWEDVLQDQDPTQPVIYSNYIPWDFLKLRGWVIATVPEFQTGYAWNFADILWDMQIVDEAHRIKNRKAAVTDYVKKVPAARRLALTGTPWERTPGDVWSLLHFVRPDETELYWTWAPKWLQKADNFFEHWKYEDALDPEAFAIMLRQYMIRRTKDEVRPDLPEKIVTRVRIEMNPAQERHYHAFDASKDVIVVVEDQEYMVSNELTKITRLQQLSTDPSQLNLNSQSSKLIWLDDFITDHPGEPIVVFSRFRRTIEALAEKYKGDMIVGGYRGTDFIEGRNNLIFGTLDAMSEGIDGLQRANHAVFLDSHWSSIKMTQAVDRIHRINITEPKNIYLLWACREDLLVLDAVDKKWTQEELIYHFLNP